MNNPQEQALNARAKIAETRLSEIEQTLAEMEKELAPRRVKTICISAVAAVGILALAAIEILTK